MKKSYIFLVGVLALCPAIFVFDQKPGTIIKVYVITILLFLISAWFFKRKLTVLLSLALSCVLSLSVVTSLYFYFEFDTTFSTVMATTFLHASQKESVDMLKYNYPYILCFALIFALHVMLSWFLSKRVGGRKFALSGLILLIYVAVSVLLYTVSGKTRSEEFLLTERLLVNSPLYNFAPIVRAFNDAKLTDTVIQAKTSYDYNWQDKGIDNFVVVIGESARRQDHAVYGSVYPTTPFIDAQRTNMQFFNQAIAPAPLTILSVPASLAKVNLGEKVPLAAWADNVISLANDLSLDTYWLSNQGSAGQSNSLITAMAKRARHHKWNETIGFDGSLVDELARVLPKPGKKLIVLHFYGSHEPACERFPRNETIQFTQDVNDNCYLNSVAYTDKQLGRLFSLLADTRSSLIYFSDHGLVRDPQKYLNYYHHDISNPTKQAFDIPMFIWYSPQVDAADARGQVFLEQYSTSNNYWLISDWLGVTHKDDRRCHSPLSDCYRTPQDVKVLDGNKNRLEYNGLADESR